MAGEFEIVPFLTTYPHRSVLVRLTALSSTIYVVVVVGAVDCVDNGRFPWSDGVA